MSKFKIHEVVKLALSWDLPCLRFDFKKWNQKQLLMFFFSLYMLGLAYSHSSVMNPNPSQELNN